MHIIAIACCLRSFIYRERKKTAGRLDVYSCFNGIVVVQLQLTQLLAFPLGEWIKSLAVGQSPFLFFTRLFWNLLMRKIHDKSQHDLNISSRTYQIFTCFSDNFRRVAISIRRRRVKYWFEENSRSNSRSWVLEKAVRIRLLDESESS